MPGDRIRFSNGPASKTSVISVQRRETPLPGAVTLLCPLGPVTKETRTTRGKGAGHRGSHGTEGQRVRAQQLPSLAPELTVTRRGELPSGGKTDSNPGPGSSPVVLQD